MPYLSNADKAIVAPSKITDYLLSREHPRGRAKAAFFESFGFSRESWEELSNALKAHALADPVSGVSATPFGMACEVVGRLLSPDGRDPFVLVVWFSRNGEDLPRLVTAVPAEDAQP